MNSSPEEKLKPLLPQSAAHVAQLVEQRFRKPQVVGSSPTVGSTIAGASERIKTGFELFFVLALYFHAFWHLIYFERSTTLVLINLTLLLFIFTYSVARHWKGFSNFGFRKDGFGAGLIYGFALLIPFFLVSVFISFFKGHQPELPTLVDFFEYFLWALAQQWVVQGYFFLRYEQVFQNKLLAIACTALTFASVHIPNSNLVWVTLIGGFYLSWMFYRTRNLFAVALCHGLISLILVFALKPAHVISRSYRVGPEPMRTLRQVLAKSITRDMLLIEFEPSKVPNILRQTYGSRLLHAQDFLGLKAIIQSNIPFFLVMSKKHYEVFLQQEGKQAGYVWASSYIWFRKFKNQKFETIKAILTLNLNQLDELYREDMLLIGNLPPPKAV